MKLYLITIVVLFLHLDCSFAEDPIVKTKDGLVRGKVIEAKIGSILTNVTFYEGIRYGKAERFSKPAPVGPWDGVYDATTPKSACYQTGGGKINSSLQDSIFKQSEDCLFLNIYVPDHYSSGAVMVFIHGGSFQAGTIFIMDGRQLAAEGDVIVVSINYRLGALGFLYGGKDSNAPGNVGLQDQLLGIKWVYDNIGSFGGDTKKITIFGESAGSMSIGAHIISPLTKGLYQRAIMQSGSPTNDYLIVHKEQSIPKTKTFADKVGCSNNETMKSMIECLRTKPVDLLVNTESNFWPVYGDEFMPVRHIDAIKSYRFNRDIDLMYGVCKDEGTGFVFLFFPETLNPAFEITKEEAKKFAVRFFTSFNFHNGQEVADFYIDKLNSNATQDEFKIALGNLVGDFILTCPSILFGEEFYSHSAQKQPTYSYRLMQASDTMNTFFPKWIGVPHATDLFFLFPDPSVHLSPREAALSHVMIRAWSNFAKTGSPGPIGSVEWEQSVGGDANLAYTSVMELQEMGTKFRMVNNLFKDTCDAFWKNKIFV
ncbi:hypothetical protein BLOT_009440 [Blomia tropicalis]|nr:hypothetical protein BLOT_009440 [Blomia tropicalis]